MKKIFKFNLMKHEVCNNTTTFYNRKKKLYNRVHACDCIIASAIITNEINRQYDFFNS